jgi:hypothetical protein
MWSKDNDVVRDAVLTTPNAYMQLVGIVQALAVGLLLQQGAFFNLLEAGRVDVRSVEFWLAFFQTTTTFQLIVLTWHVNVQTITVFQRVFGLADSYIPFSFIFAEYFVAINSAPEKFREWALSIAVFMLAALIAYLHLFLRANKDFEESKAVLDRIGNYPLVVYVFFVLGGNRRAGRISRRSDRSDLANDRGRWHRCCAADFHVYSRPLLLAAGRPRQDAEKGALAVRCRQDALRGELDFSISQLEKSPAFPPNPDFYRLDKKSSSPARADRVQVPNRV